MKKRKRIRNEKVIRLIKSKKSIVITVKKPILFGLFSVENDYIVSERIGTNYCLFRNFPSMKSIPINEQDKLNFLFNQFIKEIQKRKRNEKEKTSFNR